MQNDFKTFQLFFSLSIFLVAQKRKNLKKQQQIIGIGPKFPNQLAVCMACITVMKIIH